MAGLTAKTGSRGAKGWQETGQKAFVVSLVGRGHLRCEKQHRQEAGMCWSLESGLARIEGSSVVLWNKSLYREGGASTCKMLLIKQSDSGHSRLSQCNLLSKFHLTSSQSSFLSLKENQRMVLIDKDVNFEIRPSWV